MKKRHPSHKQRHETTGRATLCLFALSLSIIHHFLRYLEYLDQLCLSAKFYETCIQF